MPEEGKTVTQTQLFYDSLGASFPVEAFRAAARKEVESSLLIRRAAAGDMEATIALHEGFWPFVLAFEGIIDLHPFPLRQLATKFPGRVATVFRGLKEAVDEMKKEEGSHAAHWKKDAANLGIPYDRLEATTHHPVAGVNELISMGMTDDHPAFFAVLAGTEYIAEELSSFLVGSASFTQLFDRKKWVWGQVHLIPHDDGPSHLEIDLDLARACSPSDEHADRAVAEMVYSTISAFGRAANDVEKAFSRSSLAA